MYLCVSKSQRTSVESDLYGGVAGAGPKHGTEVVDIEGLGNGEEEGSLYMGEGVGVP